VLVVAEVALSLTLLAGAGLLGRSLANLWRADTGLDPARVLTFQVALPQQQYDTPQRALAFWAELRRRLAALPGVQAASVASALTHRGGWFYLGRALIEAGNPVPTAGREVPVMWNSVTPDFFRTMGQPLRRGRDFTARDDSAAPPVVIVNQAFADAMFPGGNALGRRVFSWRDERVAREIVGVVGNVRYDGAADSTTKPIIYVPLGQDATQSAAVTVRTAGDPAALLAAVRREVAAVEPGLALANVRTMEQARAASVAGPRFYAVLLGAFAALAVALAAVGLYGVLSYGVAQRGKEFGLRMALGATPGSVLRLVLGGAARLALAGAVLGVGGAVVLTRVMRALLFGVAPGDPATLGAGTVLLLGVALLASLAPAWRATRVEPLTALRAD
jgi:putative ABC transport system permease protein